MEPIKQFLLSLAKEGLIEGYIQYDNKKYIFSKAKGLAKVDITELGGPKLRKEVATEKREPRIHKEEREFFELKTEAKVRASHSYKYIFFILIFVAVLLLVILGIPYLNKKSKLASNEDSFWKEATQVKTIESYRQYLKGFPNGKYSLEAFGRIEKLEEVKKVDSQYHQLLDQAESSLNKGELIQALGTVEKIKKIKTNAEIEGLEKKVEIQIAAQSKEEKYRFYVTLSEQAYSGNELEKAVGFLDRAKTIKVGPETIALDQKIRDQIARKEKIENHARLVSLAEKALNQDALDQAQEYLAQAKKIETNDVTSALEKKILDKKAEEKRKQEEQKIDDVYNRYLMFARNYLEEKKYDRALENIRKARQIKDTEELNQFELQVEQKRKGIDQKSGETDKTDQYSQYLKDARKYFDESQYDQALENVRKAKAINPTAEAASLENEIIRIQEGLEKEKQRIEEEKKRDDKRVQVASVKIIDLPPQMINAYNETLKMIEIVKLIRGIRVIGQINLNLTVREDGKIIISRMMDSGLVVNPPISRLNVIDRISKKISSLSLSPPIDKNGTSVRVENWRVTYSVGTFANKVILRRKF